MPVHSRFIPEAAFSRPTIKALRGAAPLDLPPSYSSINQSESRLFNIRISPVWIPKQPCRLSVPQNQVADLAQSVAFSCSNNAARATTAHSLTSKRNQERAPSTDSTQIRLPPFPLRIIYQATHAPRFPVQRPPADSSRWAFARRVTTANFHITSQHPQQRLST